MSEDKWQFRWHYDGVPGEGPSKPSPWYDYAKDHYSNPSPGVTIEWRRVEPPFKPGWFWATHNYHGDFIPVTDRDISWHSHDPAPVYDGYKYERVTELPTDVD